MRKLVVLAVLVATVFAIAAAAQAQSLKEFGKKLKQAMRAEDWSTVCGVTKEIGALNDKKAVKTIIQIGLQIERKDVYDAAREALGEITGEEAVAYIYEEVHKNKKWKVRLLFVEVIANKDGDTEFSILQECLKDRKQEVVREAVLALKAKDDYKAVDALIELLGRIEKKKGLLWVDVRKALTALTGADYKTAREWEGYWTIRKDELKADPERPETARPSGSLHEPRTSIDEEKKKAPKFFGQEVMSKKIMFVIDRSNSMNARDPAMKKGEGGQLTPVDPNHKKGQEDVWGGDTSLPRDRARIERVKKELCKCIAAMDPKTKFNVIYFASTVAIWQKKLVYANAGSKKLAIKWVKGLSAMGATYTDEALKKAFENEEFDTMFLLSDGQPFRNGLLPVDPILEWVCNANRQRKVKIFTFGFESIKSTPLVNLEEMLKLLQGLAQNHNGKFTNIYW
jgi:hypothetical protein